MAGQHIVVGQGKFARHLTPKKTAAQHRAHYASKVAKTAPKTTVAKPLKLPGMAPKPATPAPIQKSLDQQKADFLEYLHRQHDSWYDEFMKWIFAINQAQAHFKDILDQKTPPSLGMELLKAAFQTLIFVAIPGLGPIKEVAKQLGKRADVLEKTADAVCELTKMTIEKFKASGEFAEGQDEKTQVDAMGIAFFDEKMQHLAEEIDCVTKAHHEISRHLTSDTVDLVTALPLARAAWKKSGWERPDNENSPTHHDQLALLFLYDLMQQYCHDRVELKGMKMVELTPGNLIPVMTINRPQDAYGTLTKDEYNRNRRQNEDYEVEFENLDSARRAKMYAYFRKIHWQLPTRPKIQDYHQLIDFWDFKE